MTINQYLALACIVVVAIGAVWQIVLETRGAKRKLKEETLRNEMLHAKIAQLELKIETLEYEKKYYKKQLDFYKIKNEVED